MKTITVSGKKIEFKSITGKVLVVARAQTGRNMSLLLELDNGQQFALELCHNDYKLQFPIFENQYITFVEGRPCGDPKRPFRLAIVINHSLNDYYLPNSGETVGATLHDKKIFRLFVVFIPLACWAAQGINHYIQSASLLESLFSGFATALPAVPIGWLISALVMLVFQRRATNFGKKLEKIYPEIASEIEEAWHKGQRLEW